jgi:hypothetical protein
MNGCHVYKNGSEVKVNHETLEQILASAREFMKPHTKNRNEELEECLTDSVCHCKRGYKIQPLIDQWKQQIPEEWKALLECSVYLDPTKHMISMCYASDHYKTDIYWIDSLFAKRQRSPYLRVPFRREHL